MIILWTWKKKKRLDPHEQNKAKAKLTNIK